jgi:hypothetical protein
LAKYDPLFAKNGPFSPISATVFRRSFSNSALIPEPQRLSGHISRDSTQIEVREKPVRTPVAITPAKPIRKRGGLGHIPIIDAHPRRDASQKAELQAEAQRKKLLNFTYAEDVRYRERTTVERVNARLKDEFGGRTIRVRGHAKVMCHLIFGIVALAADQILRLIT